MAIVLYHHPYTRAANVVWMLEEVGVLYHLKYLDLQAGDHKRPEIIALNPMGKVPILQDDKATVTEAGTVSRAGDSCCVSCDLSCFFGKWDRPRRTCVRLVSSRVSICLPSERLAQGLVA